MMKRTIALLLATFLLVGCNNSSETKLQRIIDEGNYVIVDVRTKEEYDGGHAVDAESIPYDEIDENVDLDESKTILVYCQSGRRSAIAAESLKKLGYDVYDMGAYDSVPLEKE